MSAMRAILGSRMLTAGLAAFAAVVLTVMIMGFHVVAKTDPPAKVPVASASSSHKQTKPGKPGSSCAHPLKSFLSPAYDHVGRPAGAQKHMPITTELGGPPADYWVGPEPTTMFRPGIGPVVVNYTAVSFTSDSKVVICHATLKIDTNSATKRYTLSTGPHGDQPFTIGEGEVSGGFEVVVEGRYAKRRP